MTKYDYIPTEFGRTWVASRHEARRGVYTPLSYIDINEGNRFDADVFAQIMYWHEPNTETGESRLKREKDGNYWLTKNHADWFKETRIKLQTVRKCLDRLKERKLIVYELGGEKGNVTPWIRVNWTEFERRIKLWIENNVASVSEKEYQSILDTLYHTPVTSEQGVCSDITDTVLSDNTPLLPEVKSNTEITLKTSENGLNSNTPAPDGLGSASQPPSKVEGLKDFYNRPPTDESTDVRTAVEGNPSPTGTLTTPTPPSSAPPPSSEKLDMTHLRDVAANKWCGFVSPKYRESAGEKFNKTINTVVDVFVETFPDATDDKHAWVALKFTAHWSSKTDRKGNRLALPKYKDTLGDALRTWLNDHPEIMAAMGAQLEVVPVPAIVDNGPTKPVMSRDLFGGGNRA